jgi:superfamily II DNA or RNA helicase
MVVVDEAHKAPSAQFLKVVHFMKARYKLGLTATYKRRDKLHKIIFWTLGNIRHEVDKDALIKDGHIVMPYFKMINTEFRTTVKDVQNNYSKMLAELTRDQDRNNQIVDDINTIEGKTCLIISDRKKHVLDRWNLLMYKYNKTGEVLIGDTKQKDRKRIVKRVNTGKCKWLFATGQLIGEGFDCKNLDYLFICTPIKWSGRLTQYIGRIMRPGDGEDRPVVYDYVDQHVDVLVKSSKARSKVYGTKNII